MAKCEGQSAGSLGQKVKGEGEGRTMQSIAMRHICHSNAIARVNRFRFRVERKLISCLLIKRRSLLSFRFIIIITAAIN